MTYFRSEPIYSGTLIYLGVVISLGVSNQMGGGVFRIVFACALLSGAISMPAATAENAPGVTDSEIKIGQTMPYTGPAAAFSAPGLAETAYLKMINDQGGVARST